MIIYPLIFDLKLKLTLFFVGTLRSREKVIDVESGTVNTLRVRALSNHKPPLSSVPALIIIFHCSPQWTGMLKETLPNSPFVKNNYLSECPFYCLALGQVIQFAKW